MRGTLTQRRKAAEGPEKWCCFVISASPGSRAHPAPVFVHPSPAQAIRRAFEQAPGMLEGRTQGLKSRAKATHCGCVLSPQRDVVFSHHLSNSLLHSALQPESRVAATHPLTFRNIRSPLPPIGLEAKCQSRFAGCDARMGREPSLSGKAQPVKHPVSPAALCGIALSSFLWSRFTPGRATVG
jgi:hypothetical protein